MKHQPAEASQYESAEIEAVLGAPDPVDSRGLSVAVMMSLILWLVIATVTLGANL
jgi:hypothetical protein